MSKPDVAPEIDFTEALQNAEKGDLVLAGGVYWLVVKLDDSRQNILLKWFEYPQAGIWNNIDALVDPRIDLTVTGFWEYDTPSWREHICGFVDRSCP